MTTQPIAASAPHVQETMLPLLERLFPRPRQYVVELWDGTILPAAGEAQFRLILRHPAALRRMIAPPLELSLGEAFIYGDFDVEGDLISAVALVDEIPARPLPGWEALGLLRRWRALPRSSGTLREGRGPARLRGRRHSRQRDQAAIRYHYDVGNEFYALWLDRNLQYSCAYFTEESDDLDKAQERKMEHICRKLRLKPGERLLDIGCGWGGLALYAARQYGVRALGVTLSERQWAHATRWAEEAGLGDRVRFELKDYRDVRDETFDKVVSVGMFEHVGRNHLAEYFQQAYRLLKPGGLFLNHGISRGATRTRDSAPDEGRASAFWRGWMATYLQGTGSFSQRYVFPDGELVPVSEANLIAEAAGFEVRDVENLREHYALTLRQWVHRLETRAADAIRAADEPTYHTWRLFLSASAHSFERGQINVNQALLARPDHGRVNLPLTRAHLFPQA